MKKSKLKIILLAGIFVLVLLLIGLFFIRLFSSREIDDVSPGILCEQEYLEKAEILWVIPEYGDFPISENKTWCQEILALNKTLGLHGVTHKYKEFSTGKSSSYLEEGISEFEKCFNQTPTMFKPPQLSISGENKKLIYDFGIERKGYLNQILHKVYHCSDTGRFSNKFIDFF